MPEKDLIDGLKEKYSEWFEIAGDNSPALLINILTTLLVKEKNEKEYYKNMLRIYVK